VSANNGREATNEDDENYNGFREAFNEVVRRIKKPANQFIFVLHFCLGVVVFGSLSIWIELVKFKPHWLELIGFATNSGSDDLRKNLILALATTVAAIVSLTALELLFHRVRLTTAIGIVLSLPPSIVAIILLFGSSASNSSVWLGIAAWIYSMGFWWIASADNNAYRDQPKVDDASGGNPKKALTGEPTGILV
jgi:hypothetical protein